MRRVVCVMVALYFVQAGIAFAQRAEPAQAADAEYSQHIQRALEEYRLGHWSEARAFFARAHQLTPNARTLRGMGLASYELRDYVAAIRYLQQAGQHERQPLTDTMRAEAKREIDEAESFIAHCKVSVEPSEALIKIDGEPASRDADGTLMINPGDHEITLEAEGFEPATRTLTVTGGERPELRYALRRRSAAAVVADAQLPPTAAEAAPAARSAQPGFFSLTPVKIVGLAIAGGALVAAGVGTAFSVAALHEKSSSNRECDASGCTPDGLARRERALARADAATVSFIAAGTLLAAGVLTFVLAPSQERAGAQVSMAPRVGLGSAELAVEGAF